MKTKTLILVMLLCSVSIGCAGARDYKDGDKVRVRMSNIEGIVIGATTVYNDTAGNEAQWRYTIKFRAPAAFEHEKDRKDDPHEFKYLGNGFYQGKYWQAELEGLADDADGEKQEIVVINQPKNIPAAQPKTPTKVTVIDTNTKTTWESFELNCHGVVQDREIEFAPLKSGRADKYIWAIKTADDKSIGFIMTDRTLHDKYMEGEEVRIKVTVQRKKK